MTALAAAACEPPPGPSGITIVNAHIIDGSGGPPRQGAVRIVGDRIDAVGAFDPAAGDTVVDAGGLVLAPGFIDTHSHHDIDLLDMPDAIAAVSQGITSIVAGQDGGQQFPLADFFARLEASPVAINVASFAGHGTIRGQVLEDDYQREATPEEIARMAAILDRELDAGALGLSTGLEYDPGSFAATEEVIALARIAAAKGGSYISHIRSEDQYFWQAVDEAIRIGREAALPVRITHIKLAMTRWWGQTDRLIATLNGARDAGVDLSTDVYPYPAWTTSFGWLTTLFPDRDLDRRDGAEYILNDMLSPEGILLATYGPDTAYNGMTIAEIAAIRETDPATTLMDLLKADRDGDPGTPASMMLGFAMDEPDIEAIMAWPHNVIGSDGELAGVHPRGYGTFPRFLGHYVRDRAVMSLEAGIRRITSLPASQVGIADRGSIVAGAFADLVLFDPESIADQSTPEAPHRQSTGIVNVWVNGQVVFDEGQATGARPGRPLRRPDS